MNPYYFDQTVTSRGELAQWVVCVDDVPPLIDVCFDRADCTPCPACVLDNVPFLYSGLSNTPDRVRR